MAEWVLALLLVGGCVFIYAAVKITWNIADNGVSMIEQIFGSAGRPGTMREQGYKKTTPKSKSKWSEDGKKK